MSGPSSEGTGAVAALVGFASSARLSSSLSSGVDALGIALGLLALGPYGIFIELEPHRSTKLPLVVRTGRAVVYVTAAPSLQGSTRIGGTGKS